MGFSLLSKFVSREPFSEASNAALLRNTDSSVKRLGFQVVLSYLAKADYGDTSKACLVELPSVTMTS
jgi:hypothetical protein